MVREEEVLDALAWSSISEKARIARIANKLVRGLDKYNREITKTSIADAVRATVPPYGRGKAINEGVAEEIKRQSPIFLKRKAAHVAWKAYLDHMAAKKVRINHAYASRFGRPVRNEIRHFDGAVYGEKDYWEKQAEFQKAERERDKGDDCVALLIYKEHFTVGLLQAADKLPGSYYIVVRDRAGGETVHTPLRVRCENFVEAAVSLGGPKVRSAMAQGLQVVTDWVGRRSTITYQDGKTEELAWLSEKHIMRQLPHGPSFESEPAVIHGITIVTNETQAPA